jgi:hypothetical protein
MPLKGGAKRPKRDEAQKGQSPKLTRHNSDVQATTPSISVVQYAARLGDLEAAGLLEGVAELEHGRFVEVVGEDL